jgi:hypothetical protein
MITHKTHLFRNNYRTDPNIVKGAAGLDIQGFTVINHQLALTKDEWFPESNTEKIYCPEVQALVKEVTGVKMVLINNAAFHRKLITKQADPNHYTKRGEELFDVAALRLDKPMGR